MNIKTWILMVLIVISGACLRFYGLSHESLWNDELASQVRSAYPTTEQVLKEGVLTELHPPAYHFLLHYVQKIFGDSERVLRFPSAIAGVLAIIAVFFLAKRFYTEEEGLISALLIGILWAPIYYSQEARAYSFMLLFSILSTYYLIGITNSIKHNFPISLVDYSGYVLSAIINSHFHYFGLYLTCIQGGFFFIFLLSCRNIRTPVLMFIKIYGLLALLYIPWIPFFFQQIKYQNAHEFISIGWVRPTELSDLKNFLLFCFNKSAILLYFVVFILLLGFGSYLSFSFAKMKGISLYNLISSNLFYILYWLFVPFAGVLILSQIGKHFHTNRNLLISLPAVYILFSHGLTRIPSKIYFIKYVAIFAFCCLSVYKLIFGMSYYTKPHKEQFREAVAFVADHEEEYPEDILIGFVFSKKYLTYYGKYSGLRLPIDAILGNKQDIDELKTIYNKKNPKYIWYVSVHRKPDREFLEFLHTNFEIELRKQFVNADVILFKTQGKRSGYKADG
jgi:uncharacterized membrane protein